MNKALSLLFFIFLFGYSHAQLSLDFESGISSNTQNSIRFPNSENTESDLVNIPEEFGAATTLFYRIRASYTFGEKHTISGLFAPLQFKSDGTFSRPIRFGQFTFASSNETDITYKFNSYRLTYRYQILQREKWNLGIGVTGKIRDARVAFTTPQQSDETTDVGFVPLINFNLEGQVADKLSFVLNGDALVGPVGRAEDIFAGLKYLLNPSFSVKAGYRILEGGADVDQVYNFSLIHYGSVGFTLTF